MKVLIAVLALASATQAQGTGRLDRSAPITYFVGTGTAASGFTPGDRQLALWALDQWQRASNGTLQFIPARSEDEAILRVYWTDGRAGQYGETQPLVVAGIPGAAVYVHPDLRGLGDDVASHAAGNALWRDTIVYLTCVHELGHAVGLSHTNDFNDIMYSFQFGGDIVAYFDRYVRQARKRSDLEHITVPSPKERDRVRMLYPARPTP